MLWKINAIVEVARSNQQQHEQGTQKIVCRTIDMFLALPACLLIFHFRSCVISRNIICHFNMSVSQCSLHVIILPVSLSLSLFLFRCMCAFSVLLVCLFYPLLWYSASCMRFTYISIIFFRYVPVPHIVLFGFCMCIESGYVRCFVQIIL